MAKMVRKSWIADPPPDWIVKRDLVSKYTTLAEQFEKKFTALQNEFDQKVNAMKGKV